MWTCPRCDRSFGAANRSHVCAPGMPVEVWLDERTDGQRRAAEAVLAIARDHDGLAIEAVGVGILIKRDRTIVELRPKTRWLDMSFISTLAIDSDKVARTIAMSKATAYFVHLRDAPDVDADVRRWLDAALAPTTPPARTARRRSARPRTAKRRTRR